MDSAYRRIDASGLECPEPVLRARAALADLAPGTKIEVIVTDPMAEADLAVFCARAGHDMLGVRSDGDRWIIRIRSGARKRGI